MSAPHASPPPPSAVESLLHRGQDAIRFVLESADLWDPLEDALPVGTASAPSVVFDSVDSLVRFAIGSVDAHAPQRPVGRARAAFQAIQPARAALWVEQADLAAISLPLAAPATILDACNALCDSRAEVALGNSATM
jgi:hypothetical protein